MTVKYRGFELELACPEPFSGMNRATQDVNPPGFDGTLVKHMGERKRTFTVNGIFTDQILGAFDKLKSLEALNDTEVGTLEIFDMKFEFVRIQNNGITYNRIYKNAVTGLFDVNYTVRFEQLSNEGTLASD